MFQEVSHQKMPFKFFSHIDFIVKRFFFQFQKNPGRGTHSLAMAKSKTLLPGKRRTATPPVKAGA
jgi:hypothetical protein